MSRSRLLLLAALVLLACVALATQGLPWFPASDTHRDDPSSPPHSSHTDAGRRQADGAAQPESAVDPAASPALAGRPGAWEALEDPERTLRGEVLSTSSGTGLLGAQVTVTAWETHLPSGRGYRIRQWRELETARVTTDEQGRFVARLPARLDPSRVRRLTVHASAAGHVTSPWLAVHGASRIQARVTGHFDLPAGPPNPHMPATLLPMARSPDADLAGDAWAPVRLVLAPARALVVRVTSDRDGAARQARVQVAWRDPMLTSRDGTWETDAQGEVHLTVPKDAVVRATAVPEAQALSRHPADGARDVEGYLASDGEAGPGEGHLDLVLPWRRLPVVVVRPMDATGDTAAPWSLRVHGSPFSTMYRGSNHSWKAIMVPGRPLTVWARDRVEGVGRFGWRRIERPHVEASLRLRPERRVILAEGPEVESWASRDATWHWQPRHSLLPSLQGPDRRWPRDAQPAFTVPPVAGRLLIRDPAAPGVLSLSFEDLDDEAADADVPETHHVGPPSSPGHTVSGTVSLSEADRRSLGSRPRIRLRGEGWTLRTPIEDDGSFSVAAIPPGRIDVSLDLTDESILPSHARWLGDAARAKDLRLHLRAALFEATGGGAR